MVGTGVVVVVGRVVTVVGMVVAWAVMPRTSTGSSSLDTEQSGDPEEGDEADDAREDGGRPELPRPIAGGQRQGERIVGLGLCPQRIGAGSVSSSLRYTAGADSRESVVNSISSYRDTKAPVGARSVNSWPQDGHEVDSALSAPAQMGHRSLMGVPGCYRAFAGSVAAFVTFGDRQPFGFLGSVLRTCSAGRAGQVLRECWVEGCPAGGLGGG